MKTYNRDIYSLNVRDVRALGDDNLKESFYSWVIDIANNMSTRQHVIGVMDKNDVMQEAFIAFEKAWTRVDWDNYNAIPEPEKAPYLWYFLKKTIKLELRKALSRTKDGIRIHWSNGQTTKKKMGTLTVLFPDFFTLEETYFEEVVPWDVEQLGNGLDEAMRYLLSHTDRNILEYFYGIDCEKKSLKEIAKIFKQKESWVRKRKQRALEALDIEIVKDIVKKYF